MGRARRQAATTASNTLRQVQINQAGSERTFPGRDAKIPEVASRGRQIPSADSTGSEDNSEDLRKHVRAQQNRDRQKEQSHLSQVGHILDILQTDIKSRTLYIALALQLCLFMFYLFVIGLQFRQLGAYEMISSITSSTAPPQHGGPTLDFLTWLKTQVFYIWTEPFCGDGVCQSPTEVPSFGRFGCKADCGPEPGVLPILVYIEADFSKLALPQHVIGILWKRVRWNVCTRDDDMLPEICWYKADRHLSGPKSRALEEVSLRRGDWYIRVVRDNLGMLRGRVMDVSNTNHHEQIVTLPSWEPCTANRPAPPSGGAPASSRHLLLPTLEPEVQPPVRSQTQLGGNTSMASDLSSPLAASSAAHATSTIAATPSWAQYMHLLPLKSDIELTALPHIQALSQGSSGAKKCATENITAPKERSECMRAQTTTFSNAKFSAALSDPRNITNSLFREHQSAPSSPLNGTSHSPDLAPAFTAKQNIGDELIVGTNKLMFQAASYLVRYNADDTALWNSQTAGKGATRAILQTTGAPTVSVCGRRDGDGTWTRFRLSD
ncbi:hypothetical protein CYMTET_56820 [Cymbomonas tetramitiformis]|uniref:Uncharacterized protein n=1 Tax=Cymbomonas tetramitiformis TaxID=36881 RepID=A0AAE0ELX4_9CHLO|nr:hypothetical protein CYMTET_56820 [Cymbomonas tetramitiformis]